MANDVVSKTITGSIANFTTNLTRPLQALKTYFTPNQNGSGDPSPENVRDVVSWNSIDVIQCGKNIIGRSGLEASVTKNGITATLRSDGTSYTLSGTATDRADLYILPYTNNYAWQPTSYTISVNAGLALNDTGDYFVISIVDSEDAIRYITTKSSKQFTIASNEKVRGIFIRVAEGKILDNVVVTPQIEVGSTASSYEPYKSTTYQYSFSPSDPSLVAGILNITTGELTVTHKKLVIDGATLDVSNVRLINTSTKYKSHLFAIDEDVFGTDVPIYNEGTYGGHQYPLFNYLAPTVASTMSEIWHGNLSSGNGVVLTVSSIDVSNNVYGLKSYLTTHPLEIGYELAEPQTYQLTPQEITALFGVNNIWTTANGGNEVTYLDKEHVDIALSRRRIIMSSPHIESASGSIASFSTDMAVNLKECKIAFSPVQEGSGDPSPSNVRPISGWTGMDVYQWGDSVPITYNVGSYTSRDVEWNVFPDGTFSAYGIPSGSSSTIVGTVDAQSNGVLFGSIIGSMVNKAWNRPVVYDENNNAIGYGSNDNVILQGFDLSSYEGAAKVGLSVKRSRDDTLMKGIARIVTNYGSTPTITTTPISWQSEAGTVYGGYVDLVKGEVVATHKSALLSDIEWAYSSSLGVFSAKDSNTPNDAKWSNLSTNATSPLSCEIYTTGPIKSSGTYYDTMPNNTIHIFKHDSSRGQLRVKDSRYTDTSSFVSSLGNSLLIYELATPIHTPITPTILKTLKGVNNIWSSGNGNTSISYWTH